jgi:hypothetical protein
MYDCRKRECLHDISAVSGFRQLPVSQQRAMQDFSVGFRKFASPVSIEPFGDALPRFQKHTQGAAISRVHPIQDGSNCWELALPSQEWQAPPPASPGRQLVAGARWRFGGYDLGPRRSSEDTGSGDPAPG